MDFIFDDVRVGTLKTYIHDNFTLDGTTQRMVSDIIQYVAAQGLDKEETIETLYALLNSIGIGVDEIETALDID